ncbi:MAG: CBS domain-containing protein [Candidatus Dadabacteria bacterium]|nr:MAG: CBS domain-containing protein [Candidatus Dadabacteria bacterium]
MDSHRSRSRCVSGSKCLDSDQGSTRHMPCTLDIESTTKGRTVALQLKTVADLMTPDPVTIDPAATLRDVLMLMHRYDVRHLPVTLGKKLVGILSDRDLRLYLTERDGTINEQAADEDKLDKLIAEDLMTKAPIAVRLDTPILEAIDLLLEEKIGAIPVVANSDETELVGILSYMDLLAYMRELVGDLAAG